MGSAHLNAELMRRETLSEEGAELEGRLLLRVEGERGGGEFLMLMVLVANFSVRCLYHSSA